MPSATNNDDRSIGCLRKWGIHPNNPILMGPVIKRLMDIVVAGWALLLLSPLLVWLYLRVKKEMGTPVLFTQTRIGLNERPFILYKFRTMKQGDGSDTERLSDFGTWLRSTSLDELPELWNILRGDMSLVGPRPLLPEYRPYYTERERKRHHVRPGITGLAQVSGRNALTWDDRLALDAVYVEGWGLEDDLVILCRTIATVLKKEGISADGHATMPRLDEARKGTHP